MFKIDMKHTIVLTIILAFLIVFCDRNLQFNKSSAVQQQTSSVTIEILPINDVIYKISDDLNFENWNFGILVKDLHSVTEIDCLQIRHFSGANQIYLLEYSENTLSKFLKKKGEREFTFHNFHMMLPESSSVDRLTIELFSNQASVAQKSVKLILYEQQNQYSLPIEGTWFVSSGHDFGIEHRRHLSRGHFAWDFVRINEKGDVANGSSLEDNFSYGQPVLAVASGVVIDLHYKEPYNKPSLHTRNNRSNYI